jgi:hypothetical protein
MQIMHRGRVDANDEACSRMLPAAQSQNSSTAINVRTKARHDSVLALLIADEPAYLKMKDRDDCCVGNR